MPSPQLLAHKTIAYWYYATEGLLGTSLCLAPSGPTLCVVPNRLSCRFGRTKGSHRDSHLLIKQKGSHLWDPFCFIWRRVRDSNPRYGLAYTHFPGVLLQPLGQLSKNLGYCPDETPCFIDGACSAPLRYQGLAKGVISGAHEGAED